MTDYTAPLGGTETTIERPDGTALRTVAIGSGDRTVMLAHGYAGNADGWNLVAPQLTAAGLRVITFDQRGHGKSTIGSDGISTSSMTSDYAAILDHYELDDVTLVGHSMGGFLSIAFLLGGSPATARVGSLLLMGTFAGKVSHKNPQNRLQIPLIKSGVLQRMLAFDPVATAFTKSLVGDHFDPGIIDAFVPTFLAAQHQQLVPILQAMVNEDRYAQLGQISLPCTIIIGEKDKTTPPFHTDDLHAGIPQSKLVSLPGIGHGLNWEAPDVIASEAIALATTAPTN